MEHSAPSGAAVLGCPAVAAVEADSTDAAVRLHPTGGTVAVDSGFEFDFDIILAALAAAAVER